MLQELAGRAASGQPTVVVLEGAAGIGKTALANQLVSGLEGFTLWRASADESEQGLAYGIVEQLCGGIGGTSADAAADVGGRLTSALLAAQADAPVVVLADDVQWADLPSVQVLLFAARRLHEARVLMVLIARDDADERLDKFRRLAASEPACRLRLGGLSVGELVELATATGWGGEAGLPRRAARRLRDHTGGSPLHAAALLEELPPDMILSGDELPPPRDVAGAVAARLERCTDDACRLVAAAAVLGEHCRLMVAAALAGLPEPLVALTEATGERLLVANHQPGMVTINFPDRLVWAAAYAATGPVDRARLHAQAVDLVDDPPRRLRHRAAATVGCDAQLADELASQALADLVAGDPQAAASHLLVASRLSPDDQRRARHTLLQAECLARAGDLDDARRVIASVCPELDGSRYLLVAAEVALSAGHLEEAAVWLESAWRSCDGQVDPDLPGLVACRLAEVASLSARPEEALEWGHVALTFPFGDAGRPDRSGLVMLFAALDFAWRGREAASLAKSTIPGRPEDRWDHVQWVGLRGAARLGQENFVNAQADLLSAYEEYRSLGIWSGVVAVSSQLAKSEYALGRWDDALAHAEAGLSVALESGLVTYQPLLASIAALVHTGRGEWSAAADRLAFADATADAVGAALLRATVDGAAAQLAAARGDAEAVLRHTESLALVGTVAEGNLVDWQALRVEALVTLGCLDEAESTLVQFERRATSAGRVASQVSAARARARLCAARGDHEAAEAAYHRALELALKGVGGPGLALAELDYGAHLRRAGHRRQASAQLGSALGRWRAMGAAHFATRAARELASCGLRPSKRDGRARLHLTPTELATARLAAAGNTNRQIAAELVVSEKTVEFHLGSVFRKVGVSSRRQLAAALSANLDGVDLTDAKGRTGSLGARATSRKMTAGRGSLAPEPRVVP